MELHELLPNGIPYADAPPEALEWVSQRLAHVMSTPDGGRIELTHRGNALLASAPKEELEEEPETGDEDDPAAADTAVIAEPPELPPLDDADSTDNLDPSVPTNHG